MTDLIERLRELQKYTNAVISKILLEEAIAALEAPLPDDVEQKTTWLRQEAIRICDISPNINSPNETQEWQLADMLERLAQQLAIVEKARDHHIEKHAELFQRIEELEQENQRLKLIRENYRLGGCRTGDEWLQLQEENKRLDAALAEILNNHHSEAHRIARKARAGE